MATTKKRAVAKRRITFSTVFLRDPKQAGINDANEEDIRTFMRYVAEGERHARATIEYALQVRKMARVLRRRKIMPAAMVADVNAIANAALDTKNAFMRLERKETLFEGTGFSRAKRKAKR